MNRDDRRLLWLTLAGLAVRIAFLLLEPPVRPVADELTWTNWAVEALVTPRVHFSPLRTRMIFYPPLYPYFIAVFYALFGTLTAVKWAQILMATLLVPAVGLLARRVFGAAAGLASAAVVAFYPELIWFSVHFWSETLFSVLLWWGFERLLAADSSRRTPLAVAAGVVFGLATLTRETPFYFLPVIALWLLLRRPGGLRRAAGFLLAAILTIAPWTYRNWLVFHAFVPVATAGSLNLYQGNAPYGRQEVYDRYHAVQGRIAQDRWARREGITAILNRHPYWVFEKLRDEMPNFWEVDSQAVVHIKRKNGYGPVTPAVAIMGASVVLLPYLAVLAFFVLGAAACPVDRARALLGLFLAYYIAIHVATHGYARYRLPSMPVVFMVAAWAWTSWRSRTFPRLSPRVRWLTAVAAVALGLSLVHSIRLNLNHPVFGWATHPAPIAVPDAPDDRPQ